MAFLYGSWARGLPRLDSDVDIALVFSKALSVDDIFKHITDISLLLSRDIHSEVNIIPVYSDFKKPMLYYWEVFEVDAPEEETKCNSSPQKDTDKNKQ